MRAKQCDDRLGEAVELLMTYGPCSYKFIKERVTKPARGLWQQMVADARVARNNRGWRLVDPSLYKNKGAIHGRGTGGAHGGHPPLGE
jgi:hypothetical protein